MTKKIYILDTSVCLTDANCIRSYGINDIVLPLKVLEEIYKNKTRQDGVGTNARMIIRNLDALREKGSLSKGVRIQKGKGLICVKMVKKDGLPEDLDLSVPDNEIISVALNQKHHYPKRKVIVVSRDINMRVIADSLGLIAEDYETNSVIENKDKVYEGYAEVLVDDEFIEQFYEGKEMFLDESTPKTKLYPNQFLLLISSSNPKKSAICRFSEFKQQTSKA